MVHGASAAAEASLCWNSLRLLYLLFDAASESVTLMPRAKRSIQGEFKIDGYTLIWRLHREQQLSTEDGWRGVAIHVSNTEGVHRELHLEYPTVGTEKRGATREEPVRRTILAAKVEAHIREAMAAGWDPDSRGKPFIYHVDELPG
jgi:hypothetical protein